MHYTLRELPKTKRPRERLLGFGGANLSDQELLAIILSSGTKEHNALQLGNALIKQTPLRSLANYSASELMRHHGIGEALACRLLASFELGKRLVEHRSHNAIVSSAEVIPHVGEIRQQNREHLLVLYLNGRQELIKKELVAIGGLNFNNLEPRDVLAPAVLLPCAYFIMVHNHPSGDPTPSQDDLEVTERLMAAGQLLGITLIDHVVVTATGSYSFKEKGLL